MKHGIPFPLRFSYFQLSGLFSFLLLQLSIFLLKLIQFIHYVLDIHRCVIHAMDIQYNPKIKA